MDALQYTPTSLLEAVNELLGTIGESPISTLEGRLPPDAERAIRYIHTASRKLQTRGWSWNTDEQYDLVPDTQTKQIRIPADVLDIKFASGSNLTTRGRLIYNRVEHTFEFEDSVTADVIRFLSFDEMPEPARLAVYIRAGVAFQAQSLVEDLLYRFTEADAQRAEAELDEDEVDDETPNMLTDSDSVRRITQSRRG